MEDLRKEYNVSSQKSGRSVLSSISSIGNKSVLKLLLSILIGSFIIFKPHVIGGYIGKWFNDLTQSFNDNVILETNQWYLILISIFVFTISYVLIKWVNKN